MDPVESVRSSVGSASKPVRCAQFHAAQGVDPAGTASHWDAVLVVEVPGPWPRDISEVEPFSQLADPPSSTVAGADGRTWRFQGVLPADAGHGVRVMAHERPTGGLGPFGRREWLLPPGSPVGPVEIGRALLGGDEAALRGFAELRDDPEPATVDVLLCTHGTRDLCCGGSGTRLHREVTEALIPAGTRSAGPPFRLWRSSHEGGHRFAPTALSFPEGVSWAHLDGDRMGRVLRRDADVAHLRGHVKGAVSADRPEVQAADREGFVAHGWPWLAAPRTVSDVVTDPGTGLVTVELSATLADGTRARVRSTVELVGHIPKPPCGVVDPTNVPEEPVWRVVSTDPAS